MNQQQIAEMPIEDLVSLFFHRQDGIIDHPDVKNRMQEIATYHNEDDLDFGPLLTEFCAGGLYLKGIIALLENGADPNIVHVYHAGPTRPLDAFLEYNSLDTEYQREALRTLLRYGADIHSISDYFDDTAHPTVVEMIQYCKDFEMEMECKEPSMDN